MMGRLAQLLLVGSILILPAVAQRGGGGFHGGMGGSRGGVGGFHGGGYVGQGYRGGFGYGGHGGFRGGYYPGYRHGYYGFRGRWPYRGYWPYYYGFGWGWGYPYYYGYPYAYSYPDAYSYPSTYAYAYPYDYGYTYRGPDQTSCPQANGRTLFQIKLTYQNDVWLAQDYWYTPGTLNFTTLQGEEKKTPIGSIDRNLSFQMNHDCGMNFQLP